MESDWRIADSDLLLPALLSQAGHDLVADDPLLAGMDLMQSFFQNPRLTSYRTESGILPSFLATCYSADAVGTSENDFTACFPVYSGENLIPTSASDFFLEMPKQELSSDAIPAASDSAIYHLLPDLFSVERVSESETDRVGSQQQPSKSFRFDSVEESISDDTYTLDAIVRSYKMTTGGPKPNSSSSVVADRERAKCPSPGNSTRPSSTVAARAMRRQRQGQRAQCLQKVLPCDRKMDMGTTLEEIYKYVQFLQAQVEALRSMPRLDGGFSESPLPGTLSSCGGPLGKLTRQQLLQVVVNSPVAQTKMYSRACCVFSAEQLDWLRETAASSDVDASKLH